MRQYTRDLGRTISHLNRLRRRFMAERLKHAGIGGSLYIFLLSLERNPGASQDQLSCWFFMDKGNVARNAKKLEGLGYIRREVSPDDRRQYRLFLSDSGNALIPEIRAHLTDWSNLITVGFSDDEVITLNNMLDRLEHNCNITGETE